MKEAETQAEKEVIISEDGDVELEKTDNSDNSAEESITIEETEQ